MAFGIGVYFDMIIVFDRFSSVFKMKNKNMIKIDKNTKQPIEIKENLKEKNQKKDTVKKIDYCMNELLINTNVSLQVIDVSNISDHK